MVWHHRTPVALRAKGRRNEPPCLTGPNLNLLIALLLSIVRASLSCGVPCTSESESCCVQGACGCLDTFGALEGCDTPCSADDADGAAAAEVDPAGHQAFADKLAALMYSNANECSSALGLSIAFSPIYPGCTGDAVDQIRSTLGYPDGSNAELVWGETTSRMLTSAAGQCVDGYKGECYSDAPTLKIANSVWFDDDDALNKDYEEIVGDYAMQTDFSSAESPIAVNDWVKNGTEGLINEIVDPNQPLSPPNVLIAINSIYLKARWVDQFAERNTNLDSFYSSASRTSEVSNAHFMHAIENFRYSHKVMNGHYQVIDLPFQHSSMSMIFVLPLADGVASVQSSDLIPALGDLVSTRVALSVPKFKFESKYGDELVTALKTLGIVDPFSAGTGALCGLLQDDNKCDELFITSVIQKTVIDVNEKGVEAAAVTAVEVGITSAGPPPETPIEMILDHPFQFFVYDKDEQLMLFEGRVGEPEVPGGQAQLDAVHSSPDFWSSAFSVDQVLLPPTPEVENTSTVATAPATTQSVQTGDPAVTKPTDASEPATTNTAAPVDDANPPATPAPEDAVTDPDEEVKEEKEDLGDSAGFLVQQGTAIAATAVLVVGLI